MAISSRHAFDQLKRLIDGERIGIDRRVVFRSINTYLGAMLEENKRRPEAYKECFSEVLQCLPPADSPAYEDEDASFAVRYVMATLFALGTSQSGTDVAVREGRKTSCDRGAPTSAVLILGYGGASLKDLENVAEMYAKLRPDWRAIMTSECAVQGERVEEMRTAQRREVMKAVSDVDHLFVHAMSNMGFGYWQRLAQKSQKILHEKLRGAIFDCGIALDDRLGEEEWMMHGFSKTTSRAMLVSGATPRGVPIKDMIERIERASRCMAAQVSRHGLASEGFFPVDYEGVVAAMHEWQKAHEPTVPTLCITTASDPVVPEKDVRAYAEALRTAKPDRDVRVVTLDGAHCLLLDSDRDNYVRDVDEALRRARLYSEKANASGSAVMETTPTTEEVPSANGDGFWSFFSRGMK